MEEEICPPHTSQSRSLGTGLRGFLGCFMGVTESEEICSWAGLEIRGQVSSAGFT